MFGFVSRDAGSWTRRLILQRTMGVAVEGGENHATR